jgi:DNA-binding GntR family transcriptional regulator
MLDVRKQGNNRLANVMSVSTNVLDDIIKSDIKSERRTTSDDIFDEIHTQICKMKLLPGIKLSEVEIAKSFDVSRQPVREAFIRLANLRLLTIRPQRATVVSKISLKEVEKARFIRLSIELEVFNRAFENFTSQHAKTLKDNLKTQRRALNENDLLEFSRLDKDFHKLFCVMAELPHLMDAILEHKSKVDRLCTLSLANKDECAEVYEDHKMIIEHMINRDRDACVDRLRRHLSRLDATIEKVTKSHAHYFDFE